MNLKSMLHKNIRISGRVQGVGFRYAARYTALFLGVKGFVRNLPNGDVYLEIEGEKSSVEDYLQWCHKGPPLAVIKRVDVYDGEMVGFGDFQVVA